MPFAKMVKYYAEKDDPALDLEAVGWSDTVQIARAYLALEARCAALHESLRTAKEYLRGVDVPDAIAARIDAALTDNGGPK